MDILCGGCGKTLKIPDGSAGSSIQCPHCGHGIRVPALDDAAGAAVGEEMPTPLRQDDDLADEFLTKARLALKKKMLVVCGSCGERLTVEQRLGGKVTRCPACGEQIRIPSVMDDEETLRLASPAMDLEMPWAGGEEEGPEAATVLETPVEEASAVELEPARVEAEPSAPAPHAPEWAQTVEVAQTQPAAVVVRRRSRSMAMLVLVAVVVGAGGAAAAFFIWQVAHRAQAPIQEAVVAPSPPVRPLPVPPTPPPPTAGTRPVAPPEMPPPKVEPGVTLTGAGVRVLGGDGLVPAPATMVYLYVSAKIAAGERAVNLDSNDGSVVLESPKGKFTPLGVPTANLTLPLAARPGALSVPPRTWQEETFVFLVPQDASGGTLKIANVGEVALPALQAAWALRPDALVGTYEEGGRYLKLSFSDPVMEALRAGSRQRLVVRQQQDAFDLAIAPPPLRGQARYLGEGTYSATLSDGTRTLPCSLRLNEDGKMLILYLANQPFHQIVYERQ